MDIEYRINSFILDHKETDTVDYWISRNLEKGGIELKISKLIELTSLLAEDYLKRNPDKLDSIKYIIDCDGYEHKLITE
jgi:hypothetical protein